MSDNPAGWQPDPTGKHDHRYWDGSEWTENVADAGVASTDPYDAAAEPAAPDGPGSTEPTVVTPVADTTDSYPTTTPPPAPPPYIPPSPVADGGGDGPSERGLVIGGAILAAVAIAVVAFLALGSDDDGSSDQASNESTDASDEDNSTDDGGGDDGGEEDLEDLEDACADGDFGACDDLYFAAELGSELEDFGSTCGGIADPQEGFCETTNGGEDSFSDGTTDGTTDGLAGGNFEDVIADTYQEMFGLSEEKAQCLAERVSGAIEDGELGEEQAVSEIFGYLEECDISLEEISAN